LDTTGSNWFVLLTRANRTGRVVRACRDRGVPTFAPKITTDIGRLIWAFPSYVFVLISTLFEVSGLRDVRRVAGPLAPGDAARVRDLRAQAAPDDVIPYRIQPGGRFARGQLLYIRAGPFVGRVGTFEGSTMGRARLTIEFMGSQATVFVPLHQITGD
jgi:hypothetical protein